jgi:hypothetical protein
LHMRFVMKNRNRLKYLYLYSMYFESVPIFSSLLWKFMKCDLQTMLQF